MEVWENEESECPDFVGLSRFCLKIPNHDATSGGIGKSRFWIPESYFRQINKETKYLTWIWVKVKAVWTKKNANKNLLPSVSVCIAFVQGLLRLVTSHAFWTSGKYQAWKQAWNDDQFTEPFFDRNIYARVLEMVFQGVQVAKISGDPLVFSGFALSWPLCGQKSRRGTVQRLDTLRNWSGNTNP